MQAKRDERRKRFANEPESEVTDTKKAARLERFGKEAFDEVADRKRDKKRFNKPARGGKPGNKRFRRH